MFHYNAPRHKKTIIIHHSKLSHEQAVFYMKYDITGRLTPPVKR